MEQVGGFTPFSAASFTRPADTTAYAVGDNIATTTTGSAVVPLRFLVTGRKAGSGLIIGAHMAKDQANVTNANFRLRLFSRAPFAAGSYPADNTAIVATYAALQFQIGVFDFTTWAAETAAAWSSAAPNVALSGSNQIAFNMGGAMPSNADSQIVVNTNRPVFDSQCIFGLLEARAAYAPAANSEQFTINLNVQSDG